MLRQKSLPLQKRYVSGVVRQIILSWLFAVMLEYLCLPGALRDLARLDGLAQMSLIRVIVVACGGILLLSVISRFVNPAKVERWAMVGVFGILAIAALRASFTWAFLAVCILVLIFLVVFGFCGWDMGERVAHNLISAGVMDYIELSGEISVMSLPVPLNFVGKNLIEADLRSRYDVNVVAIKREGRTIVNPKAQEVFQPEDEIIVLGTHEGVKRMGVDF